MHYIRNKKFHHHKNLLTLLKSELQTLPEGSMRVNRGQYYYQVIKSKEINITKNKKLIAQYCRKRLVIFLINHLEKCYCATEHARPKLSIKDIIKSLPASYQGFPQHYFFHSQYSDWLKLKSTPTDFFIESLKYPIAESTFVRSKSELIITNPLKDQKIPFIYEMPLKFDGHVIYPDFLIICPYTGALIPWEHFGLLNDPDYEKKMRSKMVVFHQLGFKLFENLIFTFESDITELGRIQEIIEDIILNPKF